MTRPSVTTFAELTAGYQNTAEMNDRVHGLLDAATWSDPLLARHRKHVQENQLGFGDAAFHALWLRLLEAAAQRFGEVRALEIGMFKGQVISLWSYLGLSLGLKLRISAVTPLKGQPMPRSRILNWLRYRLDAAFRERIDNGNFYEDVDYEGVVRRLFADFGADFDSVRVYRGYSSDPKVLGDLRGETFHLIYVDGDHTYLGARHDLTEYGPKVVPGGWLVVDDAGCDLPGTTFWKGHRAVSDAVKVVPEMGFRNVLNVGHLRIFERNA